MLSKPSVLTLVMYYYVSELFFQCSDSTSRKCVKSIHLLVKEEDSRLTYYNCPTKETEEAWQLFIPSVHKHLQ